MQISHTGPGINRLLAYTAAGERVLVHDQFTGQVTTITLRDLAGHVFLEITGSGATWNWQKDYIYRGEALLATQGKDQGIKHVAIDHLGTPRLLTNRTGEKLTLFSTNAWGQDTTGILQQTERMRFTGHERDLGSLSDTLDDLDYMHARYYNPNIARFLSVDPGRDVDPKVPQAWNMYAYARNNPINLTDPDGNAVNLLWDIPDLAIGAVSIGNLWVKALSGQQLTVSDNIDAISGAVGMLPIITGAAVGAKLATVVAKTDDAADAAKAAEGVSEVAAKSGKGYVGQSQNMPQRIGQHVTAGKVTPEAAANAKMTPVAGGKTAREVAEQKRINQRGGIRELENKRNPIGAKRRYLLDEEKKQ